MDATRPEDDGPPWLDVEDLELPTEGPTASRSRRLAVLAVAPWLVAGAVLTARGGPGQPPSPAGPAHTPTAATEVARFDVPAPTSTPPATRTGETAPTDPALPATITASGAWTAVGEDEARAVAIVTARRWLTDVGPDDASASDAPAPTRDGEAHAGDGGGGRYAEHLVVEAVDHPAPGAAVVTVRAVVLTVVGDGYDGIEVVRLAVPLRFDARGAAPAGEPYLLPVPHHPAPVPLDGLVPVEDTETLLLAGEALTAAGYHDVAVHTLRRSAAWPLLVTADARVAPDAPRTRVVVWLRPHLGRLVVAGTRPGHGPGHDPADVPSTAPSEHRPQEGTP